MRYISPSSFLPILVVVVLLNACSGKSLFNVHRPPVEQGNLYDYKDIAQLKIGMSQEQVRYIMGIPMLQDSFNRNRWDYYYSFSNNRNQVVKNHHLVLRFDNDTLVDIDEVIPLPQGARDRIGETEIRTRDEVAPL